MENQTHSSKGRRILLWLFVLILLLPMFQEITGIFPERALAGVEDPDEATSLTGKSWMDGSFQANFELRQSKWMGLRAPLVRMQNQIDWTVFGRLFEGTLVGKNGELFRRSSYNAITGRDFIGGEQVEYHSNHLAYVQQFLAQRGIKLLPIITPTKLRCMQGEIGPEKLGAVDTTNYEAYLAAFAKYKMAYIDLFPVLEEAMQWDTKRIFPRTGSHWTDHGAYIGFRHILSQMERTVGREYPEVIIENYVEMNEMPGTDADLGDILNLLWDFPPATIDYPTFYVRSQAPRVRPKVLVISDSFWWKIYERKLHEAVFAPGSQFRYYNWEVYSGAWEGARTVDEFDLRKSVEEVEWILLCTNEANLHKFPFGFVDAVLEAYGVLPN